MKLPGAFLFLWITAKQIAKDCWLNLAVVSQMHKWIFRSTSGRKLLQSYWKFQQWSEITPELSAHLGDFNFFLLAFLVAENPDLNPTIPSSEAWKEYWAENFVLLTWVSKKQTNSSVLYIIIEATILQLVLPPHCQFTPHSTSQACHIVLAASKDLAKQQLSEGWSLLILHQSGCNPKVELGRNS